MASNPESIPAQTAEHKAQAEQSHTAGPGPSAAALGFQEIQVVSDLLEKSNPLLAALVRSIKCIDQLTPALLSNIFSFLSAEDLSHIDSTCTLFSKLMEKNPILQNRIRVLMIESKKFQEYLENAWNHPMINDVFSQPLQAFLHNNYTTQTEFLRSDRIAELIQSGHLTVKKALEQIAPTVIYGLRQNPYFVPEGYYFPQLCAIRHGLFPIETRHPHFSEEHFKLLQETIEAARKEAESIISSRSIEEADDGGAEVTLEQTNKSEVARASASASDSGCDSASDSASDSATASTGLAGLVPGLVADPHAEVKTSTKLKRKTEEDRKREIQKAIAKAVEGCIREIQGLSKLQVRGIRLGLKREQVLHSNFSEEHLSQIKLYKDKAPKTKEEVQAYFSSIQDLQAKQLKGLQVGYNQEDARSAWFSVRHIEMLARGYQIKDLRGLNDTQTEVYEYTGDRLLASQSICDQSQLQAMKEGMPYSEVRGLTYNQIQFKKLTNCSREELLSYNPQSQHIELYKRGFKLNDIYDLSYHQAEALKLGLSLRLVRKFSSALDQKGPQPIMAIYNQVYLDLEKQQVEAKQAQESLESSEKTQGIKEHKRAQEKEAMTAEMERKLKEDREHFLTKVDAAFEEILLKESGLSYQHQSEGVKMGLSREQVLHPNYQHPHFVHLQKLKDQGKDKKEIIAEYESIIDLDYNQAQGLEMGFSSEDVQAFWYLAHGGNNGYSRAIQKGFSIEELRGLTGNEALATSMGIPLKALKSKQLSQAFLGNLHHILSIVKKGLYRIEELYKLNYPQIEGIYRWRLTLDQVLHPNFNDDTLEQLRRKIYRYDELIVLKPWQTAALNIEKGITIEVVTEPWFAPMHANALNANIPLKDIAELTILQVNTMITKRNLTRDQVTAPWFRSEHLMALEEGFEYEAIKGLSSEMVNKLREIGPPELPKSNRRGIAAATAAATAAIAAPAVTAETGRTGNTGSPLLLSNQAQAITAAIAVDGLATNNATTNSMEGSAISFSKNNSRIVFE